jgi:hypothetical protein
MIRNNVFVCNHINDLTATATTSILRHYTEEVGSSNDGREDKGSNGSKKMHDGVVIDEEEERAIELFTQTNLDILEAFKLDKKLLE